MQSAVQLPADRIAPASLQALRPGRAPRRRPLKVSRRAVAAAAWATAFSLYLWVFAVLFDLEAQRFYIFGLLLHLQDLIFLAALQVRCGQGPRRVGSCGRGRRGRECLPHPDHEPHRVCANLSGGRCRHRGFGGLGQNCQCRPGQCGVDVGEPALALGRSARACRPVGPIVFEVRGWEHRAGADTASTKQFKKSAFFVPR